MTVLQFENAVWTVEGVRIVIRAPRNQVVEDYDFQNANPQNHRVSEWLQNRVAPKIGNLTCSVIKGDGRIATNNTNLATVRDSYA